MARLRSKEIKEKAGGRRLGRAARLFRNGKCVTDPFQRDNSTRVLMASVPAASFPHLPLFVSIHFCGVRLIGAVSQKTVGRWGRVARRRPVEFFLIFWRNAPTAFWIGGHF
jgi:hypothetical protein